jgi:rubrerythrin
VKALRNELEILKTAILNEAEGYQFYTMAALRAKEPQVKEAFLHLAGEEQKHESWLRKMYREISSGQPGIEPELSAVPSPRIFRRENVGLESGSLEISVYKIGILMEMASLQFYRDAAGKTGNEAIKKLFLHLAEWENSHLEELQKIYDALKEEWWDRQGFSPA